MIAENAPNECCREDSNLLEIERRPVFYGGAPEILPEMKLADDGTEIIAGDAGTLVVYQCQVCGRKHYVHEIIPFDVGLSLEIKT